MTQQVQIDRNAPQARSESSNLNWEVPQLTLHSFDEVQEKVQQLEDLRLEPTKVRARDRGLTVGVNDDLGYDVMDLRAVRFIAGDVVFVPGFGNLKMTPHAQRQLGNEIGVRWKKFFGHTPPDEIQKSVRTHLRHLPNPTLKRVIARTHGASDILSGLPVDRKNGIEKVATDGVLRGFVSPTYSEIRDARMFDRIRNVADPGQLNDQGFAIWSLRDNGSHFMLVNKEPVDLLTAQPAGGKIGNQRTFGAPGSAHGPGDGAYFGIRIRNSEVGSYALSAEPYFVRFVCVNGIIVGVKEEKLLYRQHRGVSDRELDRLIEKMYNVLPERQQQIIDNSQKMHNVTFENDDEAKAEIEGFLSTQSKALREATIKAYEEEPVPTAYGIMQSIARVAMASRRNMDRQHDIEMLAGKYMRRVIKRTSN